MDNQPFKVSMSLSSFIYNYLKSLFYLEKPLLIIAFKIVVNII